MDEKLFKLLDDLFVAYGEVTNCEHGPIQIFKVKGFENLRLKVLELVRYSEDEKRKIKKLAKDTPRKIEYLKSFSVFSPENDLAVYEKINEIIQQLNLIIKEQI